MAVSSQRPGMGAVPYDGGATFRVWAPFASDVAVAGSFNGWQAGTILLGRDGAGTWSCDVPGVAVGDQYKFVLRNTAIAAPFWKNDPYDVVVLANMANRSYADYHIGLPRGGRWRVRLNSDWRGYSAVFTDHLSFDADAIWRDATDGMPAGGRFGIGPYACLILSQDA
jgi:1,4-alpha-glucan branching enzyme